MSQSLPPVVGSGTADDPVVLPPVNVTAPKLPPPPNAGPSGNSYVERLLQFQFVLGTGTFGNGLGNTVTVSYLRANVNIVHVGAPSIGLATGRLQGLTPTIMNALSTLGTPFDTVRNNQVTVLAGDANNGMSVAFTGIMRMCYQDFNGSPETALVFRATGMPLAAEAPCPPLSYPGGADVAGIMSGIATSLGLNFENNGVQVRLSSPYLAGNARDQWRDLAEHANILSTVENGTLAIWNKGSARGGVIPLISPASGLIGYPTQSDQGITFRTLYNPNIKFGGYIQMQSAKDPATGMSVLPAADGQWWVNRIVHDLSSQLPNGSWFTDISAVRNSGTPAK